MAFTISWTACVCRFSFVWKLLRNQWLILERRTNWGSCFCNIARIQQCKVDGWNQWKLCQGPNLSLICWLVQTSGHSDFSTQSYQFDRGISPVSNWLAHRWSWQLFVCRTALQKYSRNKLGFSLAQFFAVSRRADSATQCSLAVFAASPMSDGQSEFANSPAGQMS